jgi:fluoroacetyl-CoA thioesterase
VKATLRPGIAAEFRYVVPETKVVPALYPEAAEFQQMPRVFATGYLVGLLEWACILTLEPHLDWPAEQTVGVHIDASHSAATPPGMEVFVRVKLVAVEGKRLSFEVEAHDGVDLISKGTHQRYVIDARRFSDRAAAKVRT